jgi:RimJ/RimL family protein N-acetyltransferase
MTNWIEHPLRLEGERVHLIPLEDEYFDSLVDSSQEESIWTFMPIDGTDKMRLGDLLKQAILKREKGEQYPFVVLDRFTKRVIGSTSYLKLNEEFKSLEIGWTWFLPEVWGKGYNEECKYLLLKHCFENLDTIRVQIVTWDKNLRSRKAVERIGAKFEGVLRNAVIRHDGKRNSAYYSIIDEEWPGVKDRLFKLYRTKYASS